MTILKNKFWNGLFFAVIITILYFTTRFQNLTAIPVFGDEAIYVRWSQVIKSVETLRFVPVTDGKQPLYMWILAVALKFFNDPLVVGRTVSIFAGFGTMISLFFASIFIVNYSSKSTNIKTFLQDSIEKNHGIGLLSAFIYALLPFAFFFDRMALPDNLLSFFGITSFVFTILLSKFKRLDLAMILGIILGLSWLTKSPAIYFITLSFATFLVFNFKDFKSYIFPIVSTIFSFVIYNILRLGPQFNVIAQRNKDYVWSFSEIIKHPLDPLVPHIRDIFSIYSQYISIPVLLLSVFFFFFFIFKKVDVKKKALHLEYFIILAWWFLPLLANSAIAKVFTARYILFTLPPLIILISLGINSFIKNTFSVFKNSFSQYFIILLAFAFNIFWLWSISITPMTKSLPSVEQGYISDWTSGWGIKDASVYLIERSKVANVIVGTEGYFGTLPDGLQIYTNQIPQLTVFGVGLGFTTIPTKLIDAKNHGDEVYILMNKSRLSLVPDELKKVQIIKEYPKPYNDKLLLIKL